MNAPINHHELAILDSEDIDDRLDEIGVEGERHVRDEDILPDDALPAPIPDGFVIDSEEKAAWVVGMFVACDDETANLEAQYLKILSAIVRRRKWLEARFGEELRGFVEGRLEGKRERTMNLLTGSCSLRCRPGGPRVRDEAKAIAWALLHMPDLVEERTRHVLAVNELKAWAELTGEIPPGVEIVPDDVSFAVKAPGARKGRG